MLGTHGVNGGHLNDTKCPKANGFNTVNTGRGDRLEGCLSANIPEYC